MSDSRVSRLLMMALGLCLCGSLIAAQSLEVEKPRPEKAGAKPAGAKPAASAPAAPTQAKPPAPEKPAPAGPAAPTASAVQKPAPRAAASADVPKVAFEKFTLPNGLQVILHVDRKLPIVHVNQWYHVGSKNEQKGRTGFAHLFEHMMFQGSKNASGEYFTYVERAGANLQEGGVNGTTSSDRTNYFATVPSGNLENILWLESDRLATLLDATDIKKLDNQRDVVKNERRQGLENQPYGRWYPLALEAVFPAGHPYNWPVIGSQEDLTAASLTDVQDFFRRYYTPNNLSLVIAGDFDPAEAKRLVEKYFGVIPPGPALDRPARWVPVMNGEKIIEVSDRVPQERTYMVWPAPAYFTDDEAALNLATLILTDGLSSRLNKALVYDKQLCSAVASFPIIMEIGGAFVVQATARPGVTLTQIEAVVSDEIARLAKTGPTAAELERVKTKQEFGFVSGLEAIGGFGGKADLLNQYNTFLGDPGKFDEDLARHRRVSVSDVRAAVDKYLNTRNRALLRFHPEASGRPSQTTLDRTKAPALGEDRAFKVPEVKTTKLDNGLEIFVVERSELPKVSVTLGSRAGAAADPADKPGLANMVVRTIDMGTKTRQALQIEDALGDLGTSLGGAAQREYSSVSFEVLSRHLPAALGIVSDVVRNASFPETEVAREKKRQLDSIAQQDKNPNQVAARVRNMLAYGADHPYGHPAQGTAKSVEAMTREELAAFHREYWKPGGSTLIFVGNITLAEATKLATQHFGSWSGGAPPELTIPAPKPAAAGKIYLIDRQDSAQTVVSQFMPGSKRKSDDVYAFKLADAVWGGGGFGTRLNLNLREDKGYSYGVFSTVSQLREGGLWYAGGGVQTNKTKESLVEFDKELKAIAGGKPISQEEFTTARLRRIRGYAQQFEGYGRIGGQILELWGQGLPMTELQAEYDATEKATLPSVLAAAKKYAVPGRASLVLVGDRSKIEAGIKELDLGEIVLVDEYGKPVSGTAPRATSPQ